jgi:hypothetical protein
VSLYPGPGAEQSRFWEKHYPMAMHCVNFSSSGGTPILFDLTGNRLLIAEIASKPEIVAPDGGDTTFLGP